MENLFKEVLMNGISDMIFILKVENNDEFCFEFINTAAMKHFELSKGIIVGSSIMAIVPEEKAKFLHKQYKEVVISQKGFTFEDFYEENGEKFFVETRLSPLLDKKGSVGRIVAVVRDITQERMALLNAKEMIDSLAESKECYVSKLKYFAYHDALTELPNRLLFKERFDMAKKRFQINNNDLALIILDIDHFKLINDTYGHDTGDAVIKEFGIRIKAAIRNHDTVARLGGDEFVILLSTIQSADNALEIAERIIHTIGQPWELNGQKLTITTSMGIAIASSHPDFTEIDLMKKADIALYQAKESGRNCYKLYDGHKRSSSS